MDDFDAYDTASQYGQGLDDTASMISGYTARTQKTTTTGILLEEELDKLELGNGSSSIPSAAPKTILDDDFDGVLDDTKEDVPADLPPHACRSVLPLSLPVTRTC